MKPYLIMTQIIFVAICIAIVVVNSTQDDASTSLGILGVIGVVVALIQVYIRRKMKKNDQNQQ